MSMAKSKATPSKLDKFSEMAEGIMEWLKENYPEGTILIITSRETKLSEVKMGAFSEGNEI